MGLFDFLKGNKKRKRGARSGRSQDRRIEQGTRMLRVPPPAPLSLPPPLSGADGIAQSASVPPSPVARDPIAQPTPPPAHDADSSATQYHQVESPGGGQVVGVLVALDSELEGEIYRVSDGTNRLGRGTECEIELPSQRISRQHAELIHQDGVFAIKPLSGQNPTFVNDCETEGEALEDGDTLRLGRTTLKFRSI